MVSPASGSPLARAVTPTGVPLAAFSATVLSPASASAIAVGGSFTLLTSMVKLCVVNNPPASAALTLSVWLVAASKFSRLPPATLTTPLLGSIAKRPPASSNRL